MGRSFLFRGVFLCGLLGCSDDAIPLEDMGTTVQDNSRGDAFLSSMGDFGIQNADAVINDEGEDDEDKDFVPSSFGRRDMIYGAKLSSSFSNAYVKNLLAAVKKTAPSEIRLSLLDRLLIEDDEVKAVVVSFASSDKAFGEAIVQAYTKLCGLGLTGSRRTD